MKRIFPEFAYGDGPRTGCWWDETCTTPDWPVLEGDLTVDVGVIGGGFTGLSAALHLVNAGASVALLEARTPGWGASGRNGGFCCLGGAKITTTELCKSVGADAASSYRHAERAAVDLVAELLRRFRIDADTHSKGETQLAHGPRAFEQMKQEADGIAADYGVSPQLIKAADLAAHGMGGPFHGAMTLPVGFGLNPRKYLFGLAGGAAGLGATLFQHSPVLRMSRQGQTHLLSTPAGRVRAGAVIIATNGYSSDDVPPWLAGRYLPVQSNVLVTRPLTDAELARQGWTSDQMAYDSRHLLHYFRLMPDRRFLFGMRGGLRSSARAENNARFRTRRDFERMFPAWKNVSSDFMWSGLACVARDRVPFVGAVPGMPGLFAGLAYHGNGVAMGSYAGRLLAGLADGSLGPDVVPIPMRRPPTRFALGRLRRLMMPPLYAALSLADRRG